MKYKLLDPKWNSLLTLTREIHEKYSIDYNSNLRCG